MTVADTQIAPNRGQSLGRISRWRQAWLTIDQNTEAQNWAASGFGKLAVHMVVVLAMALSFQFSTAALVLISLTLFAIALMPAAAVAQETTITIPTEPVAQSQTCPVGFAWDADAGNCALVAQSSSPVDMLGGPAGCGKGHAAREVTS